MTLQEDILERLRARRPRPADRPWIAMSMISALDGSTAVGGTSGALGDDTDRAVLRTMREIADVIVVGASTVRAEGYRAPKRPSLELVVLSQTMSFDWDNELWHSPNVAIATTTQSPAAPLGVRVIRVGHHEVDLPALVRELPGDVIVSEGGPTLNGQLLNDDLVDEAVLTIAPFMVAGRSSRVATNDAEHLRRFALSYAIAVEDWVFVRHLRER